MQKTVDLTEQRFGQLTVIEKMPYLVNRYYAWRCKCDCGGEIIVDTKHLTRGTTQNCGCLPKRTAGNGTIAEDISNQRFGKLTAIERLPSIGGRTRWLCTCDCGNSCIVTTHELKAGKTQSCGCHRHFALRARKTDLAGQIFGRLTVIFPTKQRDPKGSVYWHCRCECGKEVDITEDSLVNGNYKSCGCRKKEVSEAIHSQLTFVDGTCVEWIKSRRHRSDNSSGYPGVYETRTGKWFATIGLQSKRYYLGRYDNKLDAISVRKAAENLLHLGFVKAYDCWKQRSTADPLWALSTPFFFHVEFKDGIFYIDTPTNSYQEKVF